MYVIRYAGCCLTGLVRAGNEDNYCCAGTYPPMVHGDIPLFEGTVSPGRKAAFAVFDGMGGEQYGEAASFLTAGSWSSQIGTTQAAAGPQPSRSASARRPSTASISETAAVTDTAGGR